MEQTPQFDVVLCPSLKKTWVHYDVEIHESGGKKNWKDRLAIYHSVHYAGFSNYASFRPDSEYSIAETLNNHKPCIARLTNEHFYFHKQVPNNWRENINSLTIRNPVYYCLKSKLVWQNIEDDENPVFSDKLLVVKEYKRNSQVYVTDCQQKIKENYDMGGSLEMKRKSVNKAVEMWLNCGSDKTSQKKLKDHFYYEMLSMVSDEIDYKLYSK